MPDIAGYSYHISRVDRRPRVRAEDLHEAFEKIEDLRLGMAVEGNHDSGEHVAANEAHPVPNFIWRDQEFQKHSGHVNLSASH